jgi:hypothetical protein
MQKKVMLFCQSIAKIITTLSLLLVAATSYLHPLQAFFSSFFSNLLKNQIFDLFSSVNPKNNTNPAWKNNNKSSATRKSIASSSILYLYLIHPYFVDRS